MKEGMWNLMPAAPGTCAECAVKHDPEMAHNQQSMAYQYFFYAKNKRWPSWWDAIQHCTPEMQKHWIEELGKKGVVVTRPVEELAGPEQLAHKLADNPLHSGKPDPDAVEMNVLKLATDRVEGRWDVLPKNLKRKVKSGRGRNRKGTAKSRSR